MEQMILIYREISIILTSINVFGASDSDGCGVTMKVAEALEQ